MLNVAGHKLALHSGKVDFKATRLASQVKTSLPFVFEARSVPGIGMTYGCICRCWSLWLLRTWMR